MSTFADAVYTQLKKIPKGKVMTYAGLAKAIGSPKAVRAVGNILGKNSNLIVVPCHRVVRSDGKIGGYAGGPAKKILLLKKEVVAVEDGKVDLEKYNYENPNS